VVRPEKRAGVARFYQRDDGRQSTGDDQRGKVKNPINIREFAVNRWVILDVRAQDERNRWFNIEVQTAFHTTFRERTALQWAENYSTELQTGDDWTELEAVIGIVLVAFPIFPEL